jgi:hypothetical protein
MKNYQIFRKPYILVEDSRNKCQPFYKEYAGGSPPRLHLDSPILCCPFQTNKRHKPSARKRQSREGFCEVCYTKFTDYEEHILEFEHREFARDCSNYKKLDLLIAGIGFDEADEPEDSTPQSPTLRMTPLSSNEEGRRRPDADASDKYDQTLHFSRIGTDEVVVHDAVPLDAFLKEILNK